MECLAETQIPCGHLVAITIIDSGQVTIHSANTAEKVIGVAARNIQREDIIDHIPNQNTADILVKVDEWSMYQGAK